MKEIIEKFFDLVSKEKINGALGELILQLEKERNDLRKECLERINGYDTSKEGQKIKNDLLQMNKDISSSYEKETFIRDFINKIN